MPLRFWRSLKWGWLKIKIVNNFEHSNIKINVSGIFYIIIHYSYKWKQRLKQHNEHLYYNYFLCLIRLIEINKFCIFDNVKNK